MRRRHKSKQPGQNNACALYPMNSRGQITTVMRFKLLFFAVIWLHCPGEYRPASKGSRTTRVASLPLQGGMRRKNETKPSSPRRGDRNLTPNFSHILVA